LQVRRIGGLLAATVLLLGLAVIPARAATIPLTSYIVVLNDSVSNPGAVAADQVGRLGGITTHVYTAALQGYSALLPTGAISRLLGDGRIKFVVPDGIMRADTTQAGATWGLDRIDQANRPTDGNYTYSNTGAGVTAYIIDTGINFTHTDFGGRASLGADKVSPTRGLLGGTSGGSTNGVDCNGHGTHVSGTVGGTTYGVAKAVTLKAVRVLDCNGSGATSDVIAGVDWVTGDHLPGRPAVANMSLGGGANAALDAAVANSIADGVSYALAAGNGNVLGNGVDACNSSPGRVATAMTIGATDANDARAGFSNFGSCVDWFAPGVNITSDWMGSNTATNTISGTSMAAPHSAGVAALYLQSSPGAAPATVRDAVYNLTTKNIVSGSKSANAHLLFTNL
jgi:subtilisin family serine protease